MSTKKYVVTEKMFCSILKQKVDGLVDDYRTPMRWAPRGLCTQRSVNDSEIVFTSGLVR